MKKQPIRYIIESVPADVSPKGTRSMADIRERPTIGFLAANIHSGASRVLWPGVVDAACKWDVNLVCFPGGALRVREGFEAQRNVIYDLVSAESLDGLISWSSTIGPSIDPLELARFHRRFRPLPMVSLAQSLDGAPTLSVDSYQGMRAAIAHLIEVHGHRRLALIRGPEHHYFAQERYRAYIDALQAYGIPLDPRLVTPPLKWEEGAEAIRLLLDERALRPQVDFRALVAVSDMQAVDALRALQARGIAVPGDVALVDFNDAPEGRYTTPPLTSVALPFYEWGARAVEILLAHMAGEEIPERTVLPCRLVVRQSCGCPSQAVLRAAAGPPEGEAASAWSRERLSAELAQAAVRIGGDAGWAGRLLDALQAELGGGAPGLFLLTLEQTLQQLTAGSGDVAGCQDVISLLRRHTLPSLSARTRLRGEDLFGQARVLIGDVARRAQAYLQLQTERQGATLRDVGQALITTFDVDRLTEVLAERLPRLGIPSCYLALYDDPGASLEQARLVLAYTEEGRVALEPGGRLFPSRHLVPKGLRPKRRHSLVVEPLYLQEEQIGFAVLEIGPGDGTVYEVLRGHISSALKGALLFRDAQRARMAAEEADHLKSRFLCTVSHELRTPLSLLVGLSEMLWRGQTSHRLPLPEPYRQDLRRIHVSAQQLDGLIRDVLDLTRSQVGQLRLVRRPVHLSEVLGAVALVGEQMARGKGLDWRVQIPENLPWVWGDPMRLRQVLLNLLSNAVKFTPHGWVQLSAEVGQGEVRVSVSDTGLGVPAAEQEAIFDEFRQSERTVARGYGGLGLGLALCRRLIEMHDGKIGVISPVEGAGGSTFYLTLPVMPREAVPPLAQEDGPGRVLLLTRRARDTARLAEHLGRHGFEVHVLDVDETEDWLPQVLASSPQAVVLDYQPAAEHGWELMLALKHNPATENVPVLFYSLLQEQDSGTVLALDYLPKPLQMATLMQALQRQGLLDRPDGGEQTVLVVDDEPGILDLHTQMVQAGVPGCRVLRAANGRDALTCMQSTRPDLVLLDLMMPELDGFGVLEAMRKSDSTRDVPVIVLTAQRLAEEDMARLNQGVAAVLQKGLFSAEETLQHVQEALERSKDLGSEMQRVVRRVMAYIHQHYAEPISRRELAAHASVSERHLDRCFRRETGVTPLTYLNRYRVQQAKALLAEGDRPITEVSLASGFSDGSYFARVFRREVGVSPAAYRRSRRGRCLP